MQPIKIIIEWRQLEPVEPVHNFVVQFAPAVTPAKVAAKSARRKHACRVIDLHGVNQERIPAELAYAAVCKEVGCDCGIRLGGN